MENRGFTLIEVMVTIAIVVIILVAIFSSQLRIVKDFKTQTKIAESHMEEIVGTELLRYDIEMAGYGLPHGFSTSITYPEAASVSRYTPNPSSLNSNPPSPFTFSDNGNTRAGNSDVLVIRSAVANISKVTKRWGYISSDGTIHQMGPTSFRNNDVLIALDAVNQMKLIVDNSGKWYFKYNRDTLPLPPNNNTIYLLYAVSHRINLRMPFNRVDYYLRRPSSNFPSKCYPNSYILYRAVIKQRNGKRNPQPLLDCVMDFQVAFGEDSNGDGTVDTWLSNLSGLSASDIRTKIRELRIFILQQEGQKDKAYKSPASITLGDSDTGVLKTFSPSGEEAHYRWNIIKITVKPMNLR